MIDPTTGAPQAFATQDLALVKTGLDAIGLSADKVSKSLTSAFTNAATSGKSLDKTLQGLLGSLGQMAVTSTMQPLQQMLPGLLSSAVSGLVGSFNTGSAVTQRVTGFADGGIVAQPTFFGSGGGVGLMGERGAEAILPLARGPDGRLGLAASAGAGAQPVSVSVSISTPDAASFSRSQVQVSSAIAQAVARGQRGL